MASSSSTTSAPQIPDAGIKAQYVKEHNIHHLFELLAARVLDKRPANPFAFLRDELVKIEEVETKKGSHDSSVVQFDRKPQQHNNNTTGAGSSSSTSAPSASSTTPAEPLGVSIAVFGIHNAGKSALIAAMGGHPDPNTTPTIGFSPVQFDSKALNLCVFDLGGGASFRGIWPHYYHDVHAVIYVVDSTSSQESLEESARVFADLASHKYISEKPFVLFANKQDVAGARTSDEIVKIMNAPNVLGSRPWIAAGCCAVAPRGTEIEDPIEWLLQTVQHKHASLQNLIKQHTAEVKEAKAKRLAEQRARVEAAKAAEAAAAAAAAAAASNGSAPPAS